MRKVELVVIGAEVGEQVEHLVQRAVGFGVALSYPFGNVQQMGPGFFPRILGAILVGFGVVTLVRGLRSGEPDRRR